MYQDKLANLKKQLEEVKVGTHPELIRRLKQLERQHHERLRLNNYYRDYLIVRSINLKTLIVQY